MKFSKSALEEFLTVDLPLSEHLAYGLWVDMDDLCHRCKRGVGKDTVKRLRAVAEDARNLAVGIDAVADRLERGSDGV